MQVSKMEGQAINFPQLRGSLAGLHYPAMAEIKYDGEFNYLRYSGPETYLINKYGTIKKDFPALNAITGNLNKAKATSATLVCEVYWDKGKLGALYELLSHKKDNACKICLFDIIELDGSNMRQKIFLERKEIMQELNLGDWLPTCWVVHNEADVQRRFNEVTSNDYEGLAVKSLDSQFVSGPCNWVKMKKKDQNDYEVTLVDKVKERIEICAYGVAGSINHVNGVSVGVKAPDKYKKHIHIGDIVTIEHQGRLKSGSLRHPVLIPRKEWK